jgi:hypothetical protein
MALSQYVGVSMAFGLAVGAEAGPDTSAEYASDFSLCSMDSQMALLRTCEALEVSGMLVSPEKLSQQLKTQTRQRCFIFGFKEWLASTQAAPHHQLPLPPAMCLSLLREWHTSEAAAVQYKGDIVWRSSSGSGSGGSTGSWVPQWAMFHLVASVSSTASSEALNAAYSQWQAFMDARNALPQAQLVQGMQTSDDWVSMCVQRELVHGFVGGLALSFGATIVGLCVYTRSLRLSLAVAASLAVTIVMLFGIFAKMGWKIGAVQAITFSIIVGCTVDYVLYLCQGYLAATVPATRSSEPGRVLAMRASLSEMSGAIASGALSTAGSAAFLLFCKVQVNADFGVMLVLATFVGAFTTLTFFPALVSLVGPRPRPQQYGAADEASEQEIEIELSGHPDYAVDSAQHSDYVAMEGTA